MNVHRIPTSHMSKSICTGVHTVPSLSNHGWVGTVVITPSSLTDAPKRITYLTHWGWVTHICVGKLTTIGSDKDLSPDRRQAFIWTNAEILLTGPFGKKLQLNVNRNYNTSIQENAFESGICELAVILSRSQWVNMRSFIFSCPSI